MRKHEIMVLVGSDIDEHQVPDLTEKHLEVITAGGSTVDDIDHWGHRRLVYDINKESETSYTVTQVTCDPALTQELNRLMGIDERIVRTKVLHPEKQAFNTNVESPTLRISVGGNSRNVDEG